ncbi:MAG: hypothetical protein ABW003_14845 [Microvirga sp.]
MTTETVIIPAAPGFELVITEWRAKAGTHDVLDRVPVVAWAVPTTPPTEEPKEPIAITLLGWHAEEGGDMVLLVEPGGRARRLTGRSIWSRDIDAGLDDANRNAREIAERKARKTDETPPDDEPNPGFA